MGYDLFDVYFRIFWVSKAALNLASQFMNVNSKFGSKRSNLITALALLFSGFPVYSHVSQAVSNEALNQQLSSFQSTSWNSLMRSGWSWQADLVKYGVDKMQDNDPAALEVLKTIRPIWDKSPINPSVVGIPIKMQGNILKLPTKNSQSGDFLFVPYLGQCIHSPFPPSNQVIRVSTRNKINSIPDQSVVLIYGFLQDKFTVSPLGSAAYFMRDAKVEFVKN